MEHLTLKNGQVVPQQSVVQTMMTLERLAATDPIVLIELVSACRDPQYKLWADTGAELVQLGVLKSVDSAGHGQIHDVIRAVVLSAAQGEDFDLTITSPIAG